MDELNKSKFTISVKRKKLKLFKKKCVDIQNLFSIELGKLPQDSANPKSSLVLFSLEFHHLKGGEEADLSEIQVGELYLIKT